MLAVSGINFAQKANLKSTLNNQQPQIKMHSQPMQDCVSFCGLPGNFGEVIPGKLYRSPLPDAKDFEEIAASGIKYIVDLGGGNDMEEAIVERLGMTYIRRDLSENILEYMPAAKKLATEIDEQDGAFLVHCKFGKDKTGKFIAFYQRYIKNLATDVIIRHAEAHGGDAALVRSILRFLPQQSQ